uniref:Translation initiation factor 2, alpha subunit n=1 Tax=Marseillevirus LCMAC201 TaxID=2506605 RepID=A0A481YWF1_9VIRU|nr:MAG: translation initiation factor 2, alpha subunit [Marseillevirus LCMAC201]
MELPARLYPAEFPEVGDIVIARITKIDESAIYCQLLEYEREGMIPLNEISRRKVRNIRQFVRVDAQEYLEVIEVNSEKGYVDLSRKQVTGTLAASLRSAKVHKPTSGNKPESPTFNKSRSKETVPWSASVSGAGAQPRITDKQEEYKTKYIMVKRVNTFFYRWSIKTDIDLVTTILWSLYDRECENVYEKVYTLSNWIDRVPTNYRDEIQEDYTKLFEKKPEKLEVTFEMVCYSPKGIIALQEAIDEGLKHSTEDAPLQCLYTGKTGQVGNIFQLSTFSNTDTALQKAVSTIKESLSQYQSKFVIV